MNCCELNLPGSLKAVVYFREGAKANLLLLGEEGEGLPERLSELSLNAVCLQVQDWNRQLSPWPAPKVMKRGGDFSGGAGEYLQAVETDVLPAAEAETGPLPWIIAGYSLAGLFSLWAVTVSPRFAGCASASGSLWYDGFTEYMRANKCLAGAAAVSLGDLEPHTRNPRLASNGEATQNVCRILEEQGVRVRFQWEQGNHFQDPEGRLFRCIRTAAELLQIQ